MTAAGADDEVEALRRRAERAILDARPREQVQPLLDALLASAPEGSKAACFAHRQLAELVVEESPWAAALHLRRVHQSDPDDDTAHALMGLCHALQGNFRVAAAAYRRAVALCPSNPWYNHNLGHLLDVALGAPDDALGYLRRAHRTEPLQEEVGASLAHCLGRVGRCEEGIAVARELLQKHPHHDDLKSLLAWLQRGAPAAEDRAARRAGAAAPRVTAPSRGPAADPLDVVLGRAGLDARRAGQLWRDLVAASAVRDQLPSSDWLAALDYALGRVDGGGATQTEVAARHGVSPSVLRSRYGALRTALKIVAGDHRYARRAER